MTTSRWTVALFGVVSLSLTACEEKRPSGAGAAAPPASLPADLFLASAPADPAGIKAAKAAGSPGGKVVLRGRIGGSKDPFVANRAIFTLVDDALPACSDNPDDACESPWDYCCEKREDIASNSATVQVVGADGAPVRAGLNGVGGLAPLARVIVIGTVSQKDDSGTFVVSATGLSVLPADK